MTSHDRWPFQVSTLTFDPISQTHLNFEAGPFEELLISRIQADDFDDVEKKVDPSLLPSKPKRKVIEIAWVWQNSTKAKHTKMRGT